MTNYLQPDVIARAQALGITLTTAKKHLGRIFDKVGVDSRSQLMARLG